MLGKTAANMYWMFRNLERCENTARLVRAGSTIAQSGAGGQASDWEALIYTTGSNDVYEKEYGEYNADNVTEFLLRDNNYLSSVVESIKFTRENARYARPALTRSVWETLNDSWRDICEALKEPVDQDDLPDLLSMIISRTKLVRGTFSATMLRNDIYSFAKLGEHIERAEYTMRMLDMKYWVLLPDLSYVGTTVDDVLWETILTAAAAESSFRWLHPVDSSPRAIATFLILNQSLPRSLVFCLRNVLNHLNSLKNLYEQSPESHMMVQSLLSELYDLDVEEIFQQGLHEFLTARMDAVWKISSQIEKDYRFYE